jgi:hypothetical protein
VTTVTGQPHHLRQLFLLADVLLFQATARLTIPSTQWVDYTHSQNKHKKKKLFFGGFNPNRFSELGSQTFYCQFLTDYS